MTKVLINISGLVVRRSRFASKLPTLVACGLLQRAAGRGCRGSLAGVLVSHSGSWGPRVGSRRDSITVLAVPSGATVPAVARGVQIPQQANLEINYGLTRAVYVLLEKVSGHMFH